MNLVTFTHLLEPPVVSVEESGVELNVLLQLEAPEWFSLRPAACELYVAPIGFDLALQISPAKQLGRTPFRSLSDALQTTIELPDSQLPRTVIYLIGEAAMTQNSRLTDGFAALQHRGIGCNVVCVGPRETASLAQFVVPCGGRLIRTDRQHVQEELTKLILLLARQPYNSLTIDLAFATTARPHVVFACTPEPCFLGEVRFECGERHVILDVGAIDPENPPSWLITVRMPPRSAGKYRLLEAYLRSGDLIIAEAPIWSEVSMIPATCAAVEPKVIAMLEHVLPLAWVDDILVARQHGDVRQISVLLERIIRHFATLGFSQAVDALTNLRLSYLRTGIFHDQSMQLLETILRSVLESSDL